ncbi:MAG: hypothetical protein JKY92_00840 [Magnetovibrio sp.]|nr:hypothetical protein [Magnetovibrio sp.]
MGQLNKLVALMAKGDMYSGFGTFVGYMKTPLPTAVKTYMDNMRVNQATAEEAKPFTKLEPANRRALYEAFRACGQAHWIPKSL